MKQTDLRYIRPYYLVLLAITVSGLYITVTLLSFLRHRNFSKDYLPLLIMSMDVNNSPQGAQEPSSNPSCSGSNTRPDNLPDLTPYKGDESGIINFHRWARDVQIEMASTPGLEHVPSNTKARREYVLGRLGGTAREFAKDHISLAKAGEAGHNRTLCTAEDVINLLDRFFYFENLSTKAMAIAGLAGWVRDFAGSGGLEIPHNIKNIEDACDIAELSPEMKKIFLYRCLNTELRTDFNSPISKAMQDWTVPYEAFRAMVISAVASMESSE